MIELSRLTNHFRVSFPHLEHLGHLYESVMNSRQASYIKDADIMPRGLLPAQQGSQIPETISTQRTKGCKERKEGREQQGPLSLLLVSRKQSCKTVFLSVLARCSPRDTRYPVSASSLLVTSVTRMLKTCSLKCCSLSRQTLIDLM